MSLYLAIDAGGTKTEYALADEHSEMARVRGGSIKRLRVDAGTAQSRMASALAELSVLSGRSLGEVTCTCVGTAGPEVPLIAEFLQEELSRRVGGRLMILGDVEIALDAAFPSRPGVVVLAGTGSNVAGRNARHGILTAGGWGPVLADQCSGYQTGLAALRGAFLALDEGRETLLLEAVMDAWKMPSLQALIEYANREPFPDFATLMPAVVLCLERGNAVAIEVVQKQAESLARLVETLLARLNDGTADEDKVMSVAFAGSVAQQVRLVRETILAGVRRVMPGAVEVTEIVDPIRGALYRARRGS